MIGLVCCAGIRKSKLPTLIGLAKRGVTFTNAHTQAPLCNPSRDEFVVGLATFDDWIVHVATGRALCAST